MNKNIDIKIDGNDVIVTDGKQEYFRMPKTEQTVSIANSIYMYHKYSDEKRV